MGKNKADEDAAVLRAITEVEKIITECQGALGHARVVENSFWDTVSHVIAQVRFDFDKKDITIDEATLFLFRAADIAHRVGSKAEIWAELFIVTITVNVDETSSKLAYKKAREHAIIGLITTIALAGAVVVLLALAGPSMGTSLRFLLPLALSGAGCGIPLAREGRRLHLRAESSEAEKIEVEINPKLSGYAQQLHHAYKTARPKTQDEYGPEGGDERNSSPKLI
ncbi:MAG: hypothetical protein P1U36_08745 [Legionellaceae bacterium]|nr:hypothetical protein [Legionellaceae bacterium]